MKLFVLALTFLSVAGILHADQIRIGVWNIQDLHHEEGHYLRDFGGFESVRRRPNDYSLLEKYRDLFGASATPADIVALQEIGTLAALNRLFPPETYETFMSLRWQDDTAKEGEGDVYTGVAVRRDSGIEVVGREDLTQLGMLGEDGRYTRSGTGVRLKAGTQELWFLSVHLKSGCPSTRQIHLSTAANCETLWRQALVLRDWIEKRREEYPIILAGDFNRQFRRLQDDFALWKAINGGDPEEDLVEDLFVKYPLTETRKCSTRKGDTTEPIDWFLVDVRIADQVVRNSFHETRWPPEDVARAQVGRGLSDHCPISLDINFD